MAMKKKWLIFFVLFLSLGLGACSSQTVDEGEDEFSEEVESADADTDAIPEDDPEDMEEISDEEFDSEDDVAEMDEDEDAFMDDDEEGLSDGEDEDEFADSEMDEEGDMEEEGDDEFADSDMDEEEDMEEEGDDEFADSDMDEEDDMEEDEDDEFADSDMDDDVTPVASSGTSYQGSTEQYTVQSGDTLMKIAFNNYGDLYQWRKVYEMNQDKISDPQQLTVGATLTVERTAAADSISKNGEPYLIKWGDTLGTISDDVYGTAKKWRRLYENNQELIKDPNRIYAGFYLYYVMTQEDMQEKQKYDQMKPSAPVAKDDQLNNWDEFNSDSQRTPSSN